MDQNIATILSAVRQGQVNAQTITLAQQTLADSNVDEKYRTFVRAVAGSNPTPRLRQSVNETLQILMKAEAL